MKEKLLAAAAELGPELDRLSLEIFNHPETAYEEVTACRLHEELLEKHGFQVERKLMGIDTGFKAVYDSGKPGLTVGFLSEYDALPEIGHGCGHNILGAVGSGAGLALKSVIDEIGGKVIVFGTPAEENCGAKIAYAKNGQFDELNIALMAHPCDSYRRCGEMLALAPVQFKFQGQTAHAAVCPEEGRNALDAVVLAVTAINALRQQMRSDSRVHGYIVRGGEASNVIPDFAEASYVVRSKKQKYNEELRERVRDCARGAALATGTTVTFTEPDLVLDNMISNLTMEQVFADQMKEVFGIELKEPMDQPASNDAGLLSKVCPMIHPMFAIFRDRTCPAHTVEFGQATLTDFAKEQMRNTIVGLALTAVEVMTKPELYQKIREEFEQSEK